MLVNHLGLTLNYIMPAKKDKFRSKYKKSGSLHHKARFVECRKQFKRLAQSKMRDNLINDDDNNLISKKFWSH